MNPHPPPGWLSSLARRHEVLGPRQLWVLGLILDLHARGQTVTVRRLCALTGIRNPNGVHFHLRGLRRKGLIGWEENLSGTVHPTVRFEVTP